MRNIKINKSLLEKIFLIGSFFYIVSAINNPFTEINFLSINSSITTLRGVAPYIMMPIIIVYLLFINRNLKLEWIYSLFLIYLFGLFVGYLVIPFGFSSHINNQDQIYWLTCNFTAFLYFYTIRDNRNFNILILKLFVFVISIISIKFIFDVYIEFFQFVNYQQRVINFFYNIHSMSPNRLFLEQPVPRSSGLSRMAIILFLFLYIQLIFVKNEKYKTILYLFIIAFLAFTLFNLQNRISIFYILILILFTFFFKISNLSLKKKIIYILCIFIIPFFIHLNIQQATLASIKIYKNLITDKVQIIVSEKTEKIENTENTEKTKKIEENEEKIKDKEKSVILTGLKKQRLFIKSSTGRKELWDRTINLFFMNNLIGYGPQADRVLLDENVSSLYFYSILCGGIISFFSIIIMTIILFLKSLKLIFVKKIFSSTEKFTCLSLLFIGYLYLRTVVEISFGVFSIDMILFFLTYNILRNSAYY
jgi:hypothetical protein